MWFHVDKYSSAHVYLRLNEGQRLEDVSQELIVDCAQLVKANSIEVAASGFITIDLFQGCKLNDIDVVYTMSSNLKKTGEMVVGQVTLSFHKWVVLFDEFQIGFHKDKDVKKVGQG